MANAVVVPKPDRERGALVKAYIVLSPDNQVRRPAGPERERFDADLIDTLQFRARGLLASYEYPREVEFIDKLPITTTGKVQRRVLLLQEEDRFRARSDLAGTARLR